MTQAVSGVHRAWLIFSGLAFLVCGMLLLFRFGLLSRSRPAAMETSAASASAAAVSPAPVINEQLTVLSGSAQAPQGRGSGEAMVAAPAAPGEVGESSSHRSPRADKSNSSVKTKSGKAGSRPQSSPHVLRPPTARSLPSRGIGLDDDAIAGSAEGRPGPNSKDGFPGGASPAPPRKAKTAAAGDTKPGRGKSKSHSPSPTPPKEDADEDGSKSTGAPPSSSPEKLTEGVLKVNAPAAMTVGESEHIRAVIGTKPHVDAVEKEASSEVGDGPRVQLGRDLMLSPLVRMELRSDVPGDFDITSFVPQAEQRLTDSETTVWDWAVQPKREGLRGLTLIVTDLKETSREPIRTKTYPVHIEVRVATIQRVHDLAVSLSSVLSGLAGLIGAWMGLLRPVLQRRREGEAGAGSQRPPQSGAPPQTPGSAGTTHRPGTDAPSTGSQPPH